jgi:N6-L-threonylcarbamoyladenine synthase
VKLHAKYGGVYPFLAKREHQRNLPIVLKQALKKANFKQIPNIDLITVTIGPGLEPCLWTGVNFAKDLARIWKKPIIPVNHIEAHIAANFIGGNFKSQIPRLKEARLAQLCWAANFKNLFPAVCLIVSGGHTQLILMKDIGNYKILGETRDDAAGECLDKCARILGLGYPGGPAIEAAAAKSRIQNSKFQIRLPRPMIHQKNFDFSFSGLKTAVLYNFKNRSLKIRQSLKENKFPTGQTKGYIRAMAAEIQQAIIDVLISKTLRATKEFKAKSIILGGGVAANNELRRQFKVQSLKSKVKFLVPPKFFCTDNAAMVAIAGYFNYLKGEIKNWENITVNANLKI